VGLAGKLSDLEAESEALRERRIALDGELGKLPYDHAYKVDKRDPQSSGVIENVAVNYEDIKEIDKNLERIKREMSAIKWARRFTLWCEPVATFILKIREYFVEQPPERAEPKGIEENSDDGEFK
jgi:hypothetical protein